MNKLLSIIIPTRNRQIYCLESIQSILEDIDYRCEVVVQDNSTDDRLKLMLSNLNSEAIVYNYNDTPLSFIDNFEQALEFASGKYFIVLGDDDSITKDILSIVEWMDKENIESLSSSFVVDYIWPNDTIEKFKKGWISVPSFTGSVQNINVEESLKALIKNGFLAYQTFNLPRTYHGIVLRSSMEKVKEKTGRYFGGLTPDIFSTVALACVIKDHRIIDFPFSIAGACPASATVNATVGGHAGKLEDAPHFNHRGNYEWESLIPKYYSVETIWAESAIKALKAMDYNGWEKLFNKYKLYIYGIYANRKYILNISLNETLSLYKNIGISRVSHFFNLGINFFKIIFNKFLNRNKPLAINHISLIDTNVNNLKDSKLLVYSAINKVTRLYETR